ncbi:hypothetical protein Bca52824_051468 [Brassica carinata]|uniref:BUB1 N-terminal domain-containing protein n=1 Tax=Brassica carinata TaxID=52824 RepID=A0A8X7R5G4_BRACI|nr:hypothetical protein Bca52824_051468 [Brassica carinata]
MACLVAKTTNTWKLIEDIDEYDGDNPLFPWIKCVKWVHEAFPPGGECSGLLVIYEQCVRSSGTRTGTRMIFFTSKSGWKMNAKPVEKLNDAYKKFMVRTMRRTKTVDDIRSFFYTGRQALGPQAKRTNLNHYSSKAPLAVYKDTTTGDQTESDKTAASSFEVFVDEEECTDSEGVEKRKKIETISPSSSNVQHIVEDPSILVATYEGTHNHLGPTLLKGMLQEKLAVEKNESGCYIWEVDGAV